MSDISQFVYTMGCKVVVQCWFFESGKGDHFRKVEWSQMYLKSKSFDNFFTIKWGYHSLWRYQYLDIQSYHLEGFAQIQFLFPDNHVKERIPIWALHILGLKWNIQLKSSIALISLIFSLLFLTLANSILWMRWYLKWSQL